MTIWKIVGYVRQNVCSLLRMATRTQACQQRSIASQIEGKNADRKMRGWQIHEYGGVDALQFNHHIKMPILKNPNEVLVRVQTTSVNPIDINMTHGYGATLLNILRWSENIEFPLAFGRDFCGEVVQKGMTVRENIQLGDKVCGVVPPHLPGCHAEYVVVDASNVTHKPKNLSDEDAGGLLYAGLTAWSGLFITGGLGGVTGAITSQGGGRSKRVCILGASGGVGNVAVQIARAENALVVATCSTNAIDFVKNLGANNVVDYTQPDANDKLRALGPFDIVLDCAGKGPEFASEMGCQYGNYVTFSSPLLRNFDSHGLAIGLARNVASLVGSNVQAITQQKGLVKWAYFVAAPHGIEYLKNLVERNKLMPITENVYDFEKANEAYQRVKDGHLRGKVVIKLE